MVLFEGTRKSVKNINILSKIEFKELINSIKKDLKDGSVILEETLEKLYLNLKNRLNI